MQILTIVTPVFGVAAIGFFWVRLGQEFPTDFVTRFVTTVSLPALMFSVLVKAEIAPSALSAILLAAVLCHLANWFVFYLSLNAFGLDRPTYLAPLIFGNTGNMGLPLCLYAFGTAGLEYAVVVFAVSAIFMFSLGLALLSGRADWAKLMKDPVLWGTGLGLLFLVCDWSVPTSALNAISLIGQVAIPMVLVTLGATIARLPFAAVPQIAPLALFKILTSASIAWGVAYLLDLSPLISSILIMQMAAPVGVTSYLLAHAHRVNSEKVAGLVLGSTLLSMITFPILLLFLL